MPRYLNRFSANGYETIGLTSDTQVTATFTTEYTDTVGFVGIWTELGETPKKHIIVAFRGSVTVENWIENLRFPKEPTPWPVDNDDNCYVHEGFLASYMDAQKIVREAVMRLLSEIPDAKIIVTGHSLGGALAQICAADLKALLGNDADIELVTFHAPRVGNINFSQAMHSLFPVKPYPKTMRFTNRADPLSHLPPYIISYVHLAGESWVNMESRTVVCNPDDFEDPNCSNSVWPDDLSNHFYIWNVFFGTDCSI